MKILKLFLKIIGGLLLVFLLLIAGLAMTLNANLPGTVFGLSDDHRHRCLVCVSRAGVPQGERSRVGVVPLLFPW